MAFKIIRKDFLFLTSKSESSKNRLKKNLLTGFLKFDKNQNKIEQILNHFLNFWQNSSETTHKKREPF